MNTFRNNYVLKLLSYISLSIILLNIVNNSLYVHSHISEKGKIVTHAHPFDQNEDNAPIKSHEHNSLEFTALDTLKIFLGSNFTFIALGVFLAFTIKNFILKTLKQQICFHFKQNKSPPVFTY